MQEQLDKLKIQFKISGLGEVEIKEMLSGSKYTELEMLLKKYGIEIIDDPKNILVQKIKDLIIEMINSEDNHTTAKISDYLADKLNHSYGYLTNLFSEVTYTTIENFIILQKIELVKQMLIENKLSLTEVSWKLNYSSVAHLSTQFKKTTGLSPTVFQRIIKKRNFNLITE